MGLVICNRSRETIFCEECGHSDPHEECEECSFKCYHDETDPDNKMVEIPLDVECISIKEVK